MSTVTVQLSTNTTVASTICRGVAPLTVNFDPALVPSALYVYGSLIYDFGDGSEIITVSRSGSNDPKSTTVSHTYTRILTGDTASWTATVSAVEMMTLTAAYIYTVPVGPITIPSLSAWASHLRLIAARTYDSGATFLTIENTGGNSTQVFNVVVTPPMTGVTTSTLVTCYDPTVISLSSTIAMTLSTLSGTTIPLSAQNAMFVFVADQGDSYSSTYITLGNAVMRYAADAYLFGGGNNYFYGQQDSLSRNWNKYQTARASQIAYPALGERDLIGTEVTDVAIGTPLPAGSNWTYAVQASAVSTSAWYLSSYSTTRWLTGYGDFGYGLTGETTVIPSTVVAGSGTCATIGALTSVYFRTTFTTTSADFVSAHAVKVQYKRDDGIILYLNGREVIRENMPVGDVDPTTSARCGAGSYTEIEMWTKYLPLSSINQGVNYIAAQVHQFHSDSQPASGDFAFEASVQVISAINHPYQPSCNGYPQVCYFSYLPTNRRYYKKSLSGDVDLFVLNSGRLRDREECLDIVEPDGVTINSIQFNWFVTEIQASTARWKIVMFYHPYIGSARTEYLMPEMDWGFKSYGVDLVLNGGLYTNEHLVHKDVHIVNCSAGTQLPIDEDPQACPYSIWLDKSAYNGTASQPALVRLYVTPTKMTINFQNTDDELLHTFDIQ